MELPQKRPSTKDLFKKSKLCVEQPVPTAQSSERYYHAVRLSWNDVECPTTEDQFGIE